ncbi:MAG TPA: F0F1 ATP synthase subunit B [Verrucomicrobiae bacterium]|nr:F0F1 ATP synthase subunit B [Verrucomicrobiae bacterium]
MSSGIIFAAAGLGDIARETGEQFGFNTQLFISQVISFCIVAFLLHRFAYKPILRVLEERRQRIAQSLTDADRIKQELASAQVKAQEILSQANVQANKAIEDARAAAAKVQEQETQKAIAAAEQIISKAREAAAADHARMLAELKREVGRLVVQTTATVTGKVLTADDQKRLTDETAQQLSR